MALFVKFWCEQTLNRVVLRIILPDLFACLHDKDKAYFRESGKPASAQRGNHMHCRLNREFLCCVARYLRCARPYSASTISPGAQPTFADYIVFGTFQRARSISPVALVETGDPVFDCRERLLDAFGGFARSARHCGA